MTTELFDLPYRCLNCLAKNYATYHDLKSKHAPSYIVGGMIASRYRGAQRDLLLHVHDVCRPYNRLTAPQIASLLLKDAAVADQSLEDKLSMNQLIVIALAGAPLMGSYPATAAGERAYIKDLNVVYRAVESDDEADAA